MTEYPERPDCCFEQATMCRCSRNGCNQMYYYSVAVKAVWGGRTWLFCSEACANESVLDRCPR